MSNFHGNPFYGTSYGYSGNLPIQPPVQDGMPYGTMGQSAYPQFRNQVPGQPPQGVYPPHIANPYAYNANSQYSNMSAPGNIIIPPPLPPPIPYQYPGYPQYSPSGHTPQPFSHPFQNVPSQRHVAPVSLPISPQSFQGPSSLPPKPLPPSSGSAIGNPATVHNNVGTTLLNKEKDTSESNGIESSKEHAGLLSTSPTTQSSQQHSVDKSATLSARKEEPRRYPLQDVQDPNTGNCRSVCAVVERLLNLNRQPPLRLW
jgi:hypothetical protein